ncbi:MAG TPA: SAM-dependent methyltransferase [Planctomycetes bacterium]|nr:SAM-dependent methyltransferase [Planctomycetota bacterium]
MDVTDYFGDRSEAYARFRPDYPDAALRAALEGLPSPAEVVDLGCGTGISSRAFARAGAAVTGVEPNAAMRAAAEATGGGPRYVDGRAEASGLPAASCDLVSAAQAFHWFDFEEALAEAHRLLRPGGRLALLWNVRQPTTPFMQDYAAVVAAGKRQTLAEGHKRVSDLRSASPAESRYFRDARQLTFDNTDPLTWEEVEGRLSSASYFPAEGPLRVESLAQLRASFERNARGGRVDYVQRTEVTLAERAG